MGIARKWTNYQPKKGHAAPPTVAAPVTGEKRRAIVARFRSTPRQPMPNPQDVLSDHQRRMRKRRHRQEGERMTSLSNKPPGKYIPAGRWCNVVGKR